MQKHREHFEIQSQAFRTQRDNLKKEEMIVVHDFTTIQEVASIHEKCYNIATYFQNENGEAHWHYFDYLSFDPKDENYVMQSWEHFIDQGNIPKEVTKIYVWSDTGLRWNCFLSFFSEAQNLYNKTFEVHYFAEYHGHSICDGHFGNIERNLETKFWESHHFPHPIQNSNRRNG